MRHLALLIAVTLGACSSYDHPSPEAARAAWEAQNVYPASYKSELLAYFRTYLNDPSGVREASVSEPALKPAGLADRYVVCVRFNAKKSSGGYVGNREGLAVYIAGKLDRFVETRNAEPRNETCRDAAYAPFPELERLSR